MGLLSGPREPPRVASLLSRPGVDARQRAEVLRFAEEIEAVRGGAISEDEFRAFRLENGVYGIRGRPDVYMVRVKVRFGVLTADQVERLGFLADRHGNGIGHVTTRQDIQFHWIPLEAVPEVLAHLAAVGLTSREACGNTVRNVTCCPEAGVCAWEPFDVTPYADALSAHFLRNPICQNLPRKFKIAFSGCPEDCAFTAIHDLGFLAATRREDGQDVQGFEVYAGGGLGPAPRAAGRLEDFLPAADLLIATEAVLRIFDRMGNRKERHRARLKFLIERLGFDAFRQLYETEKRLVRQTTPGGRVPEFPHEEPAPTVPTVQGPKEPRAGYPDWFRTNVKPQKQEGYGMAYVHLPAGDVTGSQLRRLADLTRRFCDGKVRTTPRQDLLLRWIPRESLPALYATLEDIGLGRPGANHLANVVGCPGADTCNLAITRSHRLALALVDAFAARPDLGLAEDLHDVTIKVSGCPNACGHHPIASLGLYGGAKRVRGTLAPYYHLLVDGETGHGTARFGRFFAEIPAKRVPEAVVRILEIYRSQRHGSESFRDWLRRGSRGPSVARDGGGEETMEEGGEEGTAALLREALADLLVLPPREDAPDLYRDWGDDGEFRLKTGKGECAGP